MTGTQTTMRLELTSARESVATVRSKLRELGASSGLEPELMGDLLTAVSEACNNVVLHAYHGEVGMFRVSVEVGDDFVDAEVSDAGSGINEDCAANAEDPALVNQHGLGLGVSLIQALAQQVVFADVEGDGVAVRMSFARMPFNGSPDASTGAAHSSGSDFYDSDRQRSLESSYGCHRDRAGSGRRGHPGYGASSFGWRTPTG